MKKLTNLVKKEILNVESLMKIKGAAAGQDPNCDSITCCTTTCSGAASRPDCTGATCTSAQCSTNMENSR